MTTTTQPMIAPPAQQPAQRTARQFSSRALLWVAPLTIIACISANLIVRTVVVTSFGVSPAYQPLQSPTIIGSTIVYLLLAIGAVPLVGRMSGRPVRAYRLLASVCLIVSLVFPLLALKGILPTPGISVRIL